MAESLKPLEVFFRSKRYHQTPDWADKGGVPFLIGTAVTCDASGPVTIKGEMYLPVAGERYRLWGEWQDEPKYGGQSFRFYSYEIVVNNTVDGLADYLERFVDDLGPVRSRQIVEHFGPENCLKILRENPNAVMEVPGIGIKTATQIHEHFENYSCPVDPAAYASVYNLLAEFSPPKKIVLDIIYDFKSSALEIIRENPYILLSYAGLGWSKVDKVAIKKLKYDPKGIHRNRAAVLECMHRFSGEGDTYVKKVDLEIRMSRELKVSLKDFTLASLAKDNIINISSVYDNRGKEQPQIALSDFYWAEQEIAWRLKGLIQSWSNPDLVFNVDGLEEEQIDACQFIQNHGVCLLTGPPGTGKTVTICKVVDNLIDHGFNVRIVAPTGKAAKRASEVLEKWIPGNLIDCSTIHRALEPIPTSKPVGVPEEHAKFGRGRDRFGFTRNEEFPLECNAIIIDESSMVDVELMVCLLRAIQPGTWVIFVGDENQLPSVGPGACLRDMIAGGIPNFSLTKPRRNSGRITLACHAIKDGKVPEPASELNLEAGENWIHIEEKNPDKIAQIIVELFDCTNRDKFKELQVASPQNDDSPIACANLNKILSAKLNPGRSRFQEDGTASQLARYGPGDKVVRNKNGFVELMEEVPGEDKEEIYSDFYSDDENKTIYWNNKSYYITKTYIVNGDVGRIISIEKMGDKRYAIVQFENPDKLCRIVNSESHLSLAYAMTVHKMQGSGFPVVIAPLYDFYWNDISKSGLWCRELVYTLKSRAIELLITVGKLSSLASAVRNKTVHRRKTLLTDFIKKELSSYEQNSPNPNGDIL